LVLTTGRVLYHFHTIMTRKVPGLNVIHPEGTVEINPVDAEHLDIEDGGFARVTSRRGSVVARAEVTDRSPAGTVFMTFHFKEAAVNLLTSRALDPAAKIPEYKVCAVRLEKAEYEECPKKPSENSLCGPSASEIGVAQAPEGGILTNNLPTQGNAGHADCSRATPEWSFQTASKSFYINNCGRHGPGHRSGVPPGRQDHATGATANQG